MTLLPLRSPIALVAVGLLHGCGARNEPVTVALPGAYELYGLPDSGPVMVWRGQGSVAEPGGRAGGRAAGGDTAPLTVSRLAVSGSLILGEVRTFASGGGPCRGGSSFFVIEARAAKVQRSGTLPEALKAWTDLGGCPRPELVDAREHIRAYRGKS